MTRYPGIFISIIASIIFWCPWMVKTRSPVIKQIDHPARFVVGWEAAVTPVCVLPFQYHRTITMCKKNKKPWYYFFQLLNLIFFLLPSLLPCKIPYLLLENRPCHGFQRHLDKWANAWEITVFVWESNIK